MTSTVADAPRQRRGRLRFESILDAAESVLQQRGTTEISLPEVAAAAGVPPASLYHYFPNTRVLLFELARRYMEKFEVLAEEEVDHDRLEAWTDLFRIHCDRALDFYRSHPVAMRLLLGPESGWQIRSADLSANRQIGEIQYDRLLRHFMVPDSDELARALPVSMTIGDAIWALSFARDGDVTPEMAAESLRARIAYLRLYIAENTPKRVHPLGG
ncbi:TetR/AcrR family transcriptional regulator [Tistrella mobilis]|uniref:TetR/AcrR family transcriptional regulator n=1 Tax=Tistrella mobilis TaxID=171437 RepID=UPI000C09697B|nr:TetR family transcriptional regulator [Tistrella sp.]